LFCYSAADCGFLPDTCAMGEFPCRSTGNIPPEHPVNIKSRPSSTAGVITIASLVDTDIPQPTKPLVARCFLFLPQPSGKHITCMHPHGIPRMPFLFLLCCFPCLLPKLYSTAAAASRRPSAESSYPNPLLLVLDCDWLAGMESEQIGIAPLSSFLPTLDV
jgi:hypothetical protein